MSRRLLESNAPLVGLVMEGIMAERDAVSKADAHALAGSSPAFSKQLWECSLLAPKLMGTRRERFIQEQGLDPVPPPEGLDILPPVAVIAGSSRSARAVHRACRQRYSSFDDTQPKGRCPKDMKAAATADFDRLIEKQEKAKRAAPKTKVQVAPVQLADREEGVTSKGEPLNSSYGSGEIASNSVLEADKPKVAPTVEEERPGLCLHCTEQLGARPLLSCLECKGAMHYDCYAEWAGAEPGPWDTVHCPAHKPAKKARHRGSSTCTSPRAGACMRKPSLDLTKKLAVLTQQTEAKEVFSNPTSPVAGNPSPSSSDMTHDTHHSPARSEVNTAKREQVALSPKPSIKRALVSCKSNDEELAMRLHRELNAPTRRRRGEV